MKQKNIFLLLINLLCISSYSMIIHAQETEEIMECESSLEDETPVDSETKLKKTIPFSYENENIINIINDIAAHKQINIVLPSALSTAKPSDITKVTLHIPDELSIDEAWNMVIMLLESAGYATVPQGSLIKIIKKEGREIFRDPLPTYIGVDIKQIPNNEQHIRYVHYLKNIKISDDEENELVKILKSILPETAIVKADITSNGVIIATKSECIHSAIPIIEQLDQTGFQETMDVIPLRHTSARMIADIIKEF